ncbi:MAG: helix-turn-helix transcriptional regulator [bacterium]
MKYKGGISFNTLHRRSMKDPEYKRHYDALELEFQIIHLIIKARREKNITQKKLAEMIGTTQSVIARFESGKGNPTLNFLQKLTFALGTKLKLTKI